MQLIRNVRIGARLGFSFGVLLLLTCLVAASGAIGISRVNDNVVDLKDNWLASVQSLGDMRVLANDLRRASLRHVLATSAEAKRAQQALRDDILSSKLPAAMARYARTVTSPDEAALFADIKARLAAYVELDNKLLALSSQGEAGFAEARELSGDTTGKSFAQLGEAIQKDVELNSAGAAAAAVAAGQTYRTALILCAAMVAMALLFGIVMAFTVTRTITAPIRQAVDVADTVARGDLTARVEAVGKDEPAQLLASLARMTQNLVKIVSEVRHSSDSIATGSTQIATGNADLSQRTEEQASNLQQTAASMEQLGSTVKANSDAAAQASTMATGAADAVVRGGEIVSSVVGTMQDISSASNRIGDIIGVIDGIAFQTNILALNAAVEAARAGEQGRGFAVVASEVRSLAQRSAEAAKQVKTLVVDSIAKVTAGSRLAQDAGTSMDNIVAEVRRVSQLISEISGATVEQTGGITQVGQAVTQLDQVTQQNAALVEESAAAAESLRHQAARLAETVAVFKLA